MNFWEDLKNNLNRPILALAPMAGITDLPFRVVCKEFGADVLYSEMASVTAMKYESEKTLDLVKYREFEHPYIIQLFGNDPAHFAHAVKAFDRLVKPDGYDINFGCPVKKVMKQGSGVALFQDLKLSHEVIKATIESTDKPVSIKTRIAAGEVKVLDFLDNIHDLDVKALMIHGRTLAQGFSGGMEAIDFETIKKARNHFGGVILANGAIHKWQDAYEVLEKTQADGVGLGQGVLGRPWIFDEIIKKSSFAKAKADKHENLLYIFNLATRQAEMMFEEKGDLGLVEMRKHLAWYVAGFPGARELRQQLMMIKSVDEIKDVFTRYEGC